MIMARLPGLFALTLDERIARVAAASGIDAAELRASFSGLDPLLADRMIENALGSYGLPLGVAPNFLIDGRDYLVPMAIEEPSVIAAAAHAAKRVRSAGGFHTEASEPLMVAQVELRAVADVPAAAALVAAQQIELCTAANEAAPGLVARGGGARSLELRDLGEGQCVVDLVIDCRDAMGANLLNTIAEHVGPRLAVLCGGALGARILSNLCDRRLARARARLPHDALAEDGSGRELAASIAASSRFAERDRYRAVTHNKGIMNGVDAVAVATGNDWRAVEAAAHAYAARDGRYGVLARWWLEDDGAVLAGEVELPLALATVGGALRAHPGAQLALRLLGVASASELSRVAAAVGLACNLAALRAIAREGIQRGHMRLHQRAKGGAP